MQFLFLSTISMKRFILAFIGGLTATAIAIPVFAQTSSATSTNPARSAPTQACVQAMAAMEDIMLSNADALFAAHKAAMTAHRDVIKAAAAITDDTKRTEALKKANEDMRIAIESSMQFSDAQKSAMQAAKTACTGSAMGMMHGGFGTGMPGAMFGKPKMGMFHGFGRGHMGMGRMQGSAASTQ